MGIFDGCFQLLKNAIGLTEVTEAQTKFKAQKASTPTHVKRLICVSSASSEFFPSETSRRFARVWQKHSVLSFRSVCFPRKSEADASRPEVHNAHARILGEAEGKTVLDATRDGTTQGMHFDGENRKADSVLGFETGMSYANAGNLRLELADFLRATGAPSAGSSRSAEIETER